MGAKRQEKRSVSSLIHTAMSREATVEDKDDASEGGQQMTRQNLRIITFVSIMSILALGFSLPAAGQNERQAKANQGPTVSLATMTAKLIDAEKKAREKNATVEVTVSGIELIDPAQVREMPRAGQGHLHYQVDGGFVIATPSPKLSLHELSVGPHTIVVMLVGNDHKPVGLTQTLNVTVP